MTTITAGSMHFQELNEKIRSVQDPEITIKDCMGQRYIGSGLEGRQITIQGTPGNALGAYMDGSRIIVRGNAQDATGDTMNGGTITIYGNVGDTTGYAMRGGAIYVRGNSGYRTGIHMKAYEKQQPVIVVGGKAGSFLGEYQAGGMIIVLDLPAPEYVRHKEPKTAVPPREITGHFCGTGMHGGAIYLRTEALPPSLPPQVTVTKMKGLDIMAMLPHIAAFCDLFPDVDQREILNSTFYVLMPNTKNPYTQMYTHN
jgi:glutamate synthase domain-containing protein 3